MRSGYRYHEKSKEAGTSHLLDRPHEAAGSEVTRSSGMIK